MRKFNVIVKRFVAIVCNSDADIIMENGCYSKIHDCCLNYLLKFTMTFLAIAIALM